MPGLDDLAKVEPADRAEWGEWLEENHAGVDRVWLVLRKRSSGLAYEDAIEEALRFGWIDSRARKLDEERTMLMFSPRRPGSPWARTNKRRIERLEREGLLAPAGRQVVERAKADGSWTLLDEVEDLVVPDDLAAALAATGDAREHFDRFSPSARKQILWWVVQAKRPETRARRIAETARLAAKGLRAQIDRE